MPVERWGRYGSAQGLAASPARLAGHKLIRQAPDFLWLTRIHEAHDATARESHWLT